MAEKKELPEGKRLSIAQENKIAKLFGGLRTPRSGGGNWAKMDVLSDDWGVECKCSVKPSLSYSVNKAVLDKMDHERAEMHKPYAALAFQLGENREDYFVVNTKTLKAFIDQTNDIRALIDSINSEIAELDRRYQEGKAGIAQPDSAYEQLYIAHKKEKLAFIEQLERLV